MHVNQAMSVSETWYAVTDHGTNYCNLYNLIEGKVNISTTTCSVKIVYLNKPAAAVYYVFCTGSGLIEAPGYKEITSDFLCTQRSSADCSVY